jgi:hypothetical protein
LRKNARNFAQFLKIRDYFFWGAIFGHISALFPKNTQKSPVSSSFERNSSQILAHFWREQQIICAPASKILCHNESAAIAQKTFLLFRKKDLTF